jgi:hypothetical protein
MITLAQIISVIQRIEFLLSIKDVATLYQEDEYRSEYSKEAYFAEIILQGGGDVNYPHEDDYKKSIRTFIPYDDTHDVVYEIWVNNVKTDISIMCDIWLEKGVIKYGINDIRIM